MNLKELKEKYIRKEFTEWEKANNEDSKRNLNIAERNINLILSVGKGGEE